MAATAIPRLPAALSPGTAIQRPARGTQSVPAVEKVLLILEVLANSRSGFTIRELAGTCGLAKSSVHCIILTLERRGYLYRNPRTSRYLFGRKMLRLANSALGGLELREHAEPHLRALARHTCLPAHLDILEFDEAVVVAKVEPAPGRPNTALWLGKRMDLHATAPGKALICQWSDAELLRLARQRTLARHNDNTICTVRNLREELACVRRAGYAVDDEEDVLGWRSVSAPVRDGDSRVVAAISVTGTTAEITPDNLPAVAALVCAGAAEFSRAPARI